MWKGPCFAHMDMLFTTNPLDIHHILSKNFRNYPKGDEFRKIFDFLGDGILNSEGELWEINRKVTMSVLKHAGFQNMLKTILWNKVENGLLPVLESICGHGEQINLQDIFQRFTFDTVCTVLFDKDPESLAIDFPHIACQKALLDVEEALLFRHLTPPCLWILQEFLGVGKEKKFSEARKILDQFIYNCIVQKQSEHQDENFIFLKALMREMKDQSGTAGDPTKFLRDILLDLIVAGKDTISSALSWFFYILTKNPSIEHKILEEIHKHVELKIVSTTIIYHFHIVLVEGHPALPTNAIILHMKDGLKVRLTKRIEVN
ncbi:hypothetical protein L1987_15975 [Smallanthus sonchifolius]|uniref:Uncharacterized protein n=1 Tax=Smallanthus sonchifolius TaxID=185202 RepID=A0ACB9JAI6_9ASTR|nr:hypothetical protein L1987_15975 [Smallanthus sonchifolius]